MMRTKIRTKKHAAWLDPTLDVGSSIRYTISVEGHQNRKTKKYSRSFDSKVYLTDCSESISWSGYGDSGPAHMKVKIKNAIRALNKMVKDLDELGEIYKTLPKSKGNYYGE